MISWVTSTCTIHPGRLTWNLKMMVSKRNLLFKGAIFRFYVKLWEGRSFLGKGHWLILASIHRHVHLQLHHVPHKFSIWVFPKIVGFPPPVIHGLIGLNHYKPSILGYPYCWKHPYIFRRSFWAVKKLLDDSTTWLTSRTPRICFTSSGWSIGRTLNLLVLLSQVLI